MSALVVQSLRASRGGAPVLRDASFEVAAGELCVVTGPNGAGKSTLVGCLVGALRPDAGSVLLDGRAVTGWAPRRRVRAGLAFVPEGRCLFPGLTVRENLRVAARAWGLPPAALARRAADLTERFPDVLGRPETRAGALSGGQQQQLAIVRALVTDPRVLVLDEPSVGLSPGVWADVVRHCRHLADEGHAVVLVEQRVLDVLPVADRVVMLRSGRTHPFDGSEELRRSGAATAELAARYFSPGVGP